MELKRVKQILSSPADIKVLYEGTPSINFNFLQNSRVFFKFR
ncbi:small, acid-soluble spore protein, H family [Bacillus sp. FSL W8-0223]